MTVNATNYNPQTTIFRLLKGGSPAKNKLETSTVYEIAKKQAKLLSTDAKHQANIYTTVGDSCKSQKPNEVYVTNLGKDEFKKVLSSKSYKGNIINLEV